MRLSGFRFMRDPTRGGLVTVMHEICRATKLQVRLHQRAIPVREMLGVRRDAAIIGRIMEGRAHVVLETELGGERMLEKLEDDPLPRIC